MIFEKNSDFLIIQMNILEHVKKPYPKGDSLNIWMMNNQSLCSLKIFFFFFSWLCRDKSNTPSGFTLKLRKHIRTKRLEDVRQLGYDRVCLFVFLHFYPFFHLISYTDFSFLHPFFR